MLHKIKFILVLFLMSQFSFSQQGIAVYSDYLSDNYYLLHPSMAGAANCSKLRLTSRKQWFDQSNAPSLQTVSFNGKVGEQSGGGIILFSDRNGYHSQTGVKFTYAHHIMFSRDAIDLNQLSFGMSLGLIQSQLDESGFFDAFGASPDPIIYGGIVQKDSYFNVDVGASYNYLDFYMHATVKNALETSRGIYTEIESDNLRKYLLSAGYNFGDKYKILWEPSILFQLTEQTNEKTVDINMKAYKNMDFGKLWAGLSYRTSLDGAEYLSGNSVLNQKLQLITPIIGVNYKNYMFAYTYSQVSGDVRFDNGGYHQITLGINLFCERERYECNCPAIN
jgi:type IX secretion system PorP/SprF family membrane protein